MLKHLTYLVVLGCLVFLGSPSARELTPIEELGKLIFFDENLSTPHGQSCAACHGPDVGFTGPDAHVNMETAVYPGAVHTRFGNRKPPAAAYATFSPDFHWDPIEEMYVGGMFWDGRALNTIEQAKGPFLNPLEQNNPHEKTVVRKIRLSEYADLFEEVFGVGSLDDVPTAYQHVAEAIHFYEASPEVNQFTSKYDYYLAGLVNLDPVEQQGLELFNGRGNCALCHISEPGPGGEPPLFTDYTYDNLGVPKNPNNPFYGMPTHFNPMGEDYIDYGLGEVVGEPDQMGKMKVPTLRNVGKKPYPEFVQAYMHNGVFTDLYTVVHFYNTRDVAGAGWPPPEVPENVNTDELGDLGLSIQEEEAIVAFMLALSDGYVLAPEGGASQSVQAGLAGQHLTLAGVPGGVRFVLPSAGTVDLRIYDVAGRQVRLALAGAAYPSGEHGWQWDGRDDAGRAVGSGLYMYRIASGAESDAYRTLVLR